MKSAFIWIIDTVKLNVFHKKIQQSVICIKRKTFFRIQAVVSILHSGYIWKTCRTEFSLNDKIVQCVTLFYIKANL